MPLGAVAVICASPGATPVAIPFAVTVAMAGSLLDQVNTTPPTGWLEASNAVAVNACVAPCTTVALAGVTVTLATSAGGGPSLSLQLPNVFVAGPLQTPAPFRESDVTGLAGSMPTSRTPTS